MRRSSAAPPDGYSYLGALTPAEESSGGAALEAWARLRLPLLRLGVVVLPHQELPLWLPRRFIDVLNLVLVQGVSGATLVRGVAGDWDELSSEGLA